jgi:lipopolysaccharide transport system permease protein
MSLETRVYQKQKKVKIAKLFKESIHDIYSSRFLAKQLAVRDIKAQYRQSVLGILWAFVTPLTTAFVWIFLNGTGTVKLTDTGVPYPVYAFSGTLLWSIITDAINAPTQNSLAAKNIMSKINFPKEALIISGIYKLLFNSSVKILLLILFVFVYGVGFHTSLLLFPLGIIGALILGTTIGLFITPLGMLYKDVARIVKMGLGLLMYITPVVYSIPKEGVMKTLMELNPFTPFIDTTRSFIVGATPTYLTHFIIATAICIPLFFIGLLIYRISMPILIERMSA